MRLRDRLEHLRKHAVAAHVAPLVVFVALLGLVRIAKVDDASFPWWRQAPEHWVYPLQAAICGCLLWFFRKHFDFAEKKGWLLGIGAGLVGIVAWVAPCEVFCRCGLQEDQIGWLKHLGLAARLEGFNPADGPSFWFALVMRFFRMVVIVALVEEIFWRSFLMRFLIDQNRDFREIPLGKFSWFSFVVTVGAFVLAHHPVDYTGALVYGVLACGLIYKTRSLFACVVMHAVANLALGLYVMRTGRYGFW